MPGGGAELTFVKLSHHTAKNEWLAKKDDLIDPFSYGKPPSKTSLDKNDVVGSTKTSHPSTETLKL